MDIGTRAMSLEAGGVLACDTGNIEVIHAAAWGTASVEVGDLPGQSWTGIEAMERQSGGKVEGREGDRKDRRELHGGWSVCKLADCEECI